MNRLLLHACCVVCSSHALDVLRRDFKVTVYFFNPNIEPREEYEKRRETVRVWCEKVGIPFLEGPPGHNEWLEAIQELENEPEGGARCLVCYRARLDEIARFAKENGFDYFASTLTMGRNKKAEVVNPLGRQAGEKYDIQFFEADWKKDGGQEEANRLAKENNLYRQKYCGCLFSKKDRQQVL